MFDLDIIIAALPVVLIVILALIIITQGYVKAPPDDAYIISGLRREPRVLIGRAGIKIPFFEQLDTSKPTSTYPPTTSSTSWWTRWRRSVWRTTRRA